MNRVLKNALVLRPTLALEKMDLYIKENRFVDFIDGDVEDCSGMIIMPGLVNTHTHAAMTLFRGIAEDVNLDDWLFKYIFPREDILTEKDVYIGSLVGFMEMIKNGITTFVDMYFFEDAIYQAAKDLGIRGVIARGLADTDGRGDKKLNLAEEFTKKHLDDPLIRGGFGPHAVYTCSNDYLKKIVNVSKNYNAPLTFHLFEAPGERENFRKRTGIDAFEFLESIGAFSDRTIVAHGTHLKSEELKILALKGSTLSYNPTSNAKLGNGIAPITDALAKGVNITLGTDSAASNNSLNLFNEMKFGSLIQRARDKNPTIMKVNEMVKMATSNAARAFPFEIGKIESGMLADLIVIDQENLSTVPHENFLSHLVYSFDTSAISKVMINGQWIYDGDFTNIDSKKVIDEFEKAFAGINSRI